MKQKHTGIVMCMLIVISMVPAVNAQVEYNIFSLGNQFGVGARAMGMGGAFIAVADDYTATIWNPAGLTQIRTNVFVGSMSHLKSRNEATFQSISNIADASFTNIDAVGIAMPVPTYRGSLVFAGGYNRINSYDSNFEFSWFNSTFGDSVQQTWSESIAGAMSNWVLSGAMMVSPNLSLGLSLNFWSGREEYDLTLFEDDTRDYWYESEWQYIDNLTTDYSGFNLEIGGLYSIGKHLSVGATMSTPITFTAKDNWYADTTITWDDGYEEYWGYEGKYEYKVKMPYKFGFGAAFTGTYIRLAADAEYRDYSQVRYESEPPIEGLNKSEANHEIQRNLKSTTKLRFGGELMLPRFGTILRAGYVIDPSPFKNAKSDEDRKYITFGAGLQLDKDVMFDIAWIRGTWKSYSDGLSYDVYEMKEDIRRDTILGTLSVTF